MSNTVTLQTEEVYVLHSIKTPQSISHLSSIRMLDNWLLQQANCFSNSFFISKPCIMHSTDAPATPTPLMSLQCSENLTSYISYKCSTRNERLETLNKVRSASHRYKKKGTKCMQEGLKNWIYQLWWRSSKLAETLDMERTVATLATSSSCLSRISDSFNMVKFCWNRNRHKKISEKLMYDRRNQKMEHPATTRFFELKNCRTHIQSNPCKTKGGKSEFSWIWLKWTLGIMKYLTIEIWNQPPLLSIYIKKWLVLRR